MASRVSPAQTLTEKEATAQITRSSITTAKGPARWFTGDVYNDAVAAAPESLSGG
ncbi:hypothetical protein [Streptomyces sp. NPDC058092]|uniref:hypothetical protein n=1 Tax=Streptomyces sp. NPDC058092 TaxID=3346336 RepID=UPI0036EFF246